MQFEAQHLLFESCSEYNNIVDSTPMNTSIRNLQISSEEELEIYKENQITVFLKYCYLKPQSSMTVK